MIRPIGDAWHTRHGYGVRGWSSFIIVTAALLCGCSSHRNLETPYQYPLTSPGSKFAALPPAVQNTIRAQAGTAVIKDIEKQNRNGQIIYVITFRQGALYPDLLVGPDGSVLNYDLTLAVGAARDLDGVLTGGASHAATNTSHAATNTPSPGNPRNISPSKP